MISLPYHLLAAKKYQVQDHLSSGEKKSYQDQVFHQNQKLQRLLPHSLCFYLNCGEFLFWPDEEREIICINGFPFQQFFSKQIEFSSQFDKNCCRIFVSLVTKLLYLLINSSCHLLRYFRLLIKGFV